MSEQQIQLQINVNIGSQKYLIKVPKNANRHQFIHHFLVSNGLNPKFQNSIIKMVEQRLKEQQLKQSQSGTESYQTSKVSEQQVISRLTEDNKAAETVKQEQPETVSRGIKNQFLSKIKSQLEAHRQYPKDSRKVYEQWKIRQKQKVLKEKPNNRSKSPMSLTPTKESHSPDHFYKKGLQFKQNCESNCQNEFKKLYPFKLHEKQLKEDDINKLCTRLSKEKKDFDVKKYLSRKLDEKNQQQATRRVQTPVTIDPIKQKLREADAQIDRALYHMIKQGELTYARIRPKSRSPFRKTFLQ